MGLEYVDIFYHHRPDPDTPLEETMAALDLLVRGAKRCMSACLTTRPNARGKHSTFCNGWHAVRDPPAEVFYVGTRAGDGAAGDAGGAWRRVDRLSRRWRAAC